MDSNVPVSLVPNQSYWAELAQRELEEGANNPVADIHTVLCVDISASVRHGSAWEQTQQFFNEFITGLEEARLESDINVEHVALSVFGGEVKVVQRLTTNYTLIRQAFSALQLGGPSPLVGGLLMALAGLANPSTPICNGIRIRPRIILITDGHPTNSLVLSGPDVCHLEPVEQVAVLLAVSTIASEIVRLHCVPVGDADLPFLEKISAQSHGKLFSYKDGRMLARRSICTFRAGHVIHSWTKMNDVGKPFGIELSLEDAMKSNLQISSSSVEEQEHILQIAREALETNLENEGETELDTDHYEIADPYVNLPSLGTRVRRGPDWNKGAHDDQGPGTVVGHHKDQKQVKVEWDKSRHSDVYRYGDMGQYDVLIDNEPRVLQSELIATGCLVRRGEHWKYGNQDGTPGAIGIVLAVKENGIVVVRWPNKSKNYYRYGAEGCFDLEICEPVENPAKIQTSSVTHPEYPLEQEPFITQEARIQQNSIQKYHNESKKLPPLGTRVRRGVAWDKGQQDGDGPGTIVGHNDHLSQVYVEWDGNRQRNLYCFNHTEISEVVVVDEPRILQPGELIVTGCHVKQGKHWMYGNDNDTPAAIGVVLNVREDGMVLVRWPNKSKDYYRYGAEGYFDLEICDPHDIQVESHMTKILSPSPNLDQSSTKQVPTEKGREKNKVLKKKGEHEASSMSILEQTESNMIRKMSGAYVEDQRTSNSTTMSPATITTEEIRSTTPHETTSTKTEAPTTTTISNIHPESATTEVPTTSTTTLSRKSTTQPPMTTSTEAITSTATSFATTTRTEAVTKDIYSEDKSSASTTSATTKTTTELPIITRTITPAKTFTKDTPTTTSVPVGFDRIKNIFYKKEDVLGYGCNGTVVFRGKFDERDVAVKRLLKEYFSLADQEVKLLRESDQHPNVIRYFWMEEDSHFLFIALELCEGNLHDYVEGKLQNMKNIEPIELLHQSLSGLAHLHSLGIVHRDLKPHNILISKSSAQGEVRAMISDFGFSKKLPPEKMAFSSKSNVLGTEGWIAPEMLKSGQKRTIAVDIFSAGCMMHYVLTKGLHPFGEYASEIQCNIRQGNFHLDRLPVTSDGFIAKDIIEKMLASEPETRPTAKAVLNHLLFWKKTEKLQFLEAASDRIVEKMVPELEQDEEKIVSVNWTNHLCQELQNDIRKDFSEKAIRYSGSSVKDLLRYIRTKKHHYNKMPEDVRKSLGSLPDEYLDYFTSRFPLLLLHTYRVMECCAKENTFKAYYKTE